MKNSSKILFFTILVVGTMITVSSNSWLGAWIGLEINLLTFIPLMTQNNNTMSSEASLKYFLIQALASSILLFAVVMSMIKSNMQSETYQPHNMSVNMIIMSSLLMKSGGAPFHFWFPSVMEGISWNIALILMTWQKIAPLMLISYLTIKQLMMMSALLSVLFGAIGGLNQTSLRKLMSFSSISHLGWMITAMLSSEKLWMLYFSIYTILNFNLILFFISFKLIHMNQLFSLFFVSRPMKFIMMTNLLSLGGLPPFMGFIPKWLVIQSLTLGNQLIMMTLITTLTLVTIFFYIRLCYSAIMLNYLEPNWTTTTEYINKTMYMYITLSFVSSFTLFLISLTYFML